MYNSQQRVENQGFNGNTQRNRCLFWHYEGNQAMKIRNDKGNRSDLNWQLFLLFGLLFCWMSHLLWWRPGCRTHWHQILSSVLKASTFRLQMMLPSFNMFPCPLVNLSPHLSDFFLPCIHLFIHALNLEMNSLKELTSKMWKWLHTEKKYVVKLQHLGWSYEKVATDGVNIGR